MSLSIATGCGSKPFLLSELGSLRSQDQNAALSTPSTGVCGSKSDRQEHGRSMKPQVVVVVTTTDFCKALNGGESITKVQFGCSFAASLIRLTVCQAYKKACAVVTSPSWCAQCVLPVHVQVQPSALSLFIRSISSGLHCLSVVHSDGVAAGQDAASIDQ